MAKVTTTLVPLNKSRPVNFPSSVVPGPDVTVWSAMELFTQQTLCPAVIVAALGLNVNELAAAPAVASMVALAPVPAQLAGGLELGP